jgi:hypothetical protein
MRIRSAAWAGGFVVFLLGLGGCSSENELTELTGTVKVDGALVETGSINFVAVDGKSPSCGGKITNGVYSVMVPVGLMKVAISAPKVYGQKALYNKANSPTRPLSSESLPLKYSSIDQTELRYEVTPGKNQKDFELSTN